MNNLSINEAKRRTDTLQGMLPTIKAILSELFIDPEQFARTEDFCIELLAIADAEISHAMNMRDIEINKEIYEILYEQK